MSAGKIVLLVFGVIVILISVGLSLAGGTLLWVNSAFKDSEGFYTTGTVRLERDSYAIITHPADIHAEPRWYWGQGNLATIKVEGSSASSSKQIFIGIARESDLEPYLSGVNYDEITGFNFYPHRVEYRNHPGTSKPAAPTSQTFWMVSAHGAGFQKLQWELETGSYSLVLMNDDGSAPIDMRVSVGARIPQVLFAIGLGLLVGGIVVLIIGGLMIYLAVRR